MYVLIISVQTIEHLIASYVVTPQMNTEETILGSIHVQVLCCCCGW